jgi:hypothetical protein
MFLKLKEFGDISFLQEQSVSLSIVHVGRYLVALLCIPPFIDYLFRVYLIFWFLYFDSFQVKVQVVSKWMMDYIGICFWIVDFNIGMILDLVVMICKLLL